MHIFDKDSQRTVKTFNLKEWLIKIKKYNSTLKHMEFAPFKSEF